MADVPTNKEAEELETMIKFFGNLNNFNRLPLSMQVRYIDALLEFGNKLKPLYVAAQISGWVDPKDTKQ